jgi:hypothetical protein
MKQAMRKEKKPRQYSKGYATVKLTPNTSTHPDSPDWIYRKMVLPRTVLNYIKLCLLSDVEVVKLDVAVWIKEDGEEAAICLSVPYSPPRLIDSKPLDPSIFITLDELGK